MPLYDCMLLLKPHVDKERLVDLVSRIGKHVYTRKGVLTDIKSFGTIQLGYGIRKRDGRHYEGKLMQMTMMVPPSFHKDLHYLNAEERLLRWIVVKHRDVNFSHEYGRNDDFLRDEFTKHPKNTLLGGDDSGDESDEYEEAENEATTE